MNKILSKIIKNAINFKLKESNKQLSLGSSKIGGKPHLPKDFIWPYFVGTNFNDETKNRPLSFIAQINLEEVQKYEIAKEVYQENETIDDYDVADGR